MKIRAPDDFHAHFRDDSNTRMYVASHAQQFRRALVMPNLAPEPVRDGATAVAYRTQLLIAADQAGFRSFQPLVTIQLTTETTPKMIFEAKKMGVTAAKFYPRGATTNSNAGVPMGRDISPVLKAMAHVGMNLCVHGEDPSYTVMEREYYFGSWIADTAKAHPKLKITVEHVSDERTLGYARIFDNVACSITAHHLELTIDDVIGDGLKPHNYCKPIAKFNKDRYALRKAVTSGNPKFFFGSDSAPHRVDKKECACGAAGVFTAPIAMQLLATRFESLGALDKLEGFTSEFGAKWYGLPLNTGTLTLRRRKWHAPETVSNGGPSDDVAVFKGGEQLSWSVDSLSG